MLTAPHYLILPGESLPISKLSSLRKVRTCKRELDVDQRHNIIAKQAGLLCVHEDKISINSNPIHYFPEVDDFVIVQITGKNSELYFCDLGNGLNYNLNQLEFEGATKKNKPSLSVGQIVFARVLELNYHLKGKLSCIDPRSKKEWVQSVSVWGRLLEKACSGN